MTIAEVHGKISSTGRNLHNQLEDLLTSDVFSACKYVRPQTLLLPFLSSATALTGEAISSIPHNAAVDAKYHFWPRLEHGEPDLVIIVRDVSGGTHLFMIEAKYYSGKSSAALGEDELELASAPSDQLAGEYEDLLTLERQFSLGPERIDDRSLIYVTAHRSIPVHSIQESMREIERFHPDLPDGPVFWTNWFSLLPLLDQMNEAEHWEMEILADLRGLMVKKGFVAFGGFGSVSPMTTTEQEVFYESRGRVGPETYRWAIFPAGVPAVYEGVGRGKPMSYLPELPSLPAIGRIYDRGVDA